LAIGQRHSPDLARFAPAARAHRRPLDRVDGISHTFAARSRNCPIMSRAASITAIPLENVTRLPPVRKL
jgi:hypothetical protein